MLSKYEQQLNELRSMILAILNQACTASEKTLEAFETSNKALYEEAVEILKNVQNDANRIDNELITTFALFGPEAKELRQLVSFLKMTNEIVRIAEGIKKYARRIKEHCESECDLNPIANTIIQLHKSSIAALRLIRDCFEQLDNCDVEAFYRKVMVEESKNDDLFAILEKEILDQVISETELATEYVRVLGTLRKLERSCDRSVNIANLMLYAKQGGEMHVYS